MCLCIEGVTRLLGRVICVGICNHSQADLRSIELFERTQRDCTKVEPKVVDL